MNRAERRRWEKENWQWWERLVRFKRHEIKPRWLRTSRPWYEVSEPRSPDERVKFIDRLLVDLGEVV